MPQTAELYRTSFSDDTSASARPDHSDWWNYKKIKHGLQRECNNVKEQRVSEPGRRLVSATTRDLGLNFVSIMTCIDDSGGFLKRDRIVELLYVASFQGSGGSPLSNAHGEEIRKMMEVSSVAVDDTGTLFVFASPLIVGKFMSEFFSEQLNFFLRDIRRAAVQLYY